MFTIYGNDDTDSTIIQTTDLQCIAEWLALAMRALGYDVWIISYGRDCTEELIGH